MNTYPGIRPLLAMGFLLAVGAPALEIKTQFSAGIVLERLVAETSQFLTPSGLHVLETLPRPIYETMPLEPKTDILIKLNDNGAGKQIGDFEKTIFLKPENSEPKELAKFHVHAEYLVHPNYLIVSYSIAQDTYGGEKVLSTATIEVISGPTEKEAIFIDTPVCALEAAVQIKGPAVYTPEEGNLIEQPKMNLQILFGALESGATTIPPSRCLTPVTYVAKG